jgi:hypothetical protein
LVGIVQFIVFNNRLAVLLALPERIVAHAVWKSDAVPIIATSAEQFHLIWQLPVSPASRAGRLAELPSTYRVIVLPFHVAV